MKDAFQARIDHGLECQSLARARRDRADLRGALSTELPLGNAAAMDAGAKFNSEHAIGPAEIVAGKKAEQPPAQGVPFRKKLVPSSAASGAAS